MAKDASVSSILQAINVEASDLNSLPSGERAARRVAAYDEANATRGFAFVVVAVCV
jgi:hypothetical protein